MSTNADLEEPLGTGAGSSMHKTAILVIHGIGQQDPYETNDHFARGLVDHFERANL